MVAQTHWGTPSYKACISTFLTYSFFKKKNTGFVFSLTDLHMNFKKKIYSISASKTNRRALFFLKISERM